MQQLVTLFRSSFPHAALLRCAAPQAAHAAWACLITGAQHANIRPFAQLFLARLFGRDAASMEQLLLPALKNYSEARYQVGERDDADQRC